MAPIKFQRLEKAWKPFWTILVSQGEHVMVPSPMGRISTGEVRTMPSRLIVSCFSHRASLLVLEDTESLPPNINTKGPCFSPRPVLPEFHHVKHGELVPSLGPRSPARPPRP